MFVLKHDAKPAKEYIKQAEFTCTGIDITYCEKEEQAMKFASLAVAMLVARCLASYGNFYPVEESQLGRD